MYQDGVFGSNRKSHRGKARWKLVDESLGKELDISSSFCIPIKSLSTRKTEDADKEEWVIIDDGTDPSNVAMTPNALTNRSGFCLGSTPTKPSAERVRKRSAFLMESPTLLATIPNSGKITLVHIQGQSLFDSSPAPVGRKRGRPKGSKNKPKPPPPVPVPLSAKKAAAIRVASGKKNDDSVRTRRSVSFTPDVKRPRGRPKGSKNRPKHGSHAEPLKQAPSMTTSATRRASEPMRLRESGDQLSQGTEYASSEPRRGPSPPKVQGTLSVPKRGRGRPRKHPKSPPPNSVGTPQKRSPGQHCAVTDAQPAERVSSTIGSVVGDTTLNTRSKRRTRSSVFDPGAEMDLENSQKLPELGDRIDGSRKRVAIESTSPTRSSKRRKV